MKTTQKERANWADTARKGWNSHLSTIQILCLIDDADELERLNSRVQGNADVLGGQAVRTPSDLTRMRACAPLLPSPGNKIVVELLDEIVCFREVAENAMHVLLHVDADMSERIEVAKTVAEAMGHKWPPYEGEDDGP